MIVLEKPYTSDVMLDWLVTSQHPVLDNDYARGLAAQGHALCLVPEAEAARRVAAGERTYTCSENALDWVIAADKGRTNGNAKHAVDAGESLAQAIRLCKDKLAMRKALAKLDTSLYFRACTLDELSEIDLDELHFPVVVKPTVGFLSFGVHVVRDASAWDTAIKELRDEVAAGTVFPESVIGSSSFIVEGFITGQEYAVDLYYDDSGAPVILDVMQHDFRDDSDTSDHLYYTSRAIMARAAKPLATWFAEANRELGFKNFCIHVELRVSYAPGEDPLDAMKDMSHIHVIEFNPLRFAGFCSTDLAYYAYGFRTYEWYLEGKSCTWDERSDGQAMGNSENMPATWLDDGAVTAFVVVEAPTQADAIDVEALVRDMRASSAGIELCALRPLSPREHGLSAFPFVRIPSDGDFEGFRQFALNLDANRYAEQN